MSSHKAKSKVLDDSEDDDPSNETFVVYGTELPDVITSGEKKDEGKFQPVWKQEVRDEKGRRRLHGAFKGGWSAGYFNTVGSKEGWTPSSFVSSRKNRTERQVFKPEDFMDEEDLEELDQNKQLVATEEFDSLGSTERDLERKRALANSMDTSGSLLGALPDKFIDDFVLPSKEPVGIRLLKAMGWREGQGIGPRVKKKKRDYDDIDDEDNEDQIFNALLAPKNTSIVSFEQKNNNHGLGFNPFENAPEFVFQSDTSKGDSYLRKDKPKSSFPIRGAIGTGVFDDDDDDDLYTGTSMADFNTSLMDEDDEDIIIMGNMKYSKMSNPSTESQMKKSSFLDNKLCHDGTQPLRGFMLARKPLPIDKWFSPPDLPPGYVPVHEFDTQNQYTQDTSKKNIKQKQTTLAIVAEQRGALLGESPLNAPARSVFDYVSRKDKERLDNIIRPVIDTSGDKNINKPPEIKIPKIEKDVALAALKGFIPFEDNKKKQARYRKYLEIHAELIAPELLKKPEELTADEFSKELDEFSQAARIFRPMSKMIASRFTSSSSPADEFKQPVPGLRAGAGNDPDIPSVKQKDTNQLDSESTAEAAAKMNMFGPLTRSKSIFYPSKLLCKRFNVANPHPEHAQSSSSGKTQKGQKEVLSKETMNEIINKQDEQSFPGFNTTASSSINVQSSTSDTTNLNESEQILDISNQPDDTKEDDKKPYTRPAMELFKSIFGDSGSEDDEDAPKHKKPPNLVIGDLEPQNQIRDRSPTPISYNVDEDSSHKSISYNIDEDSKDSSHKHSRKKHKTEKEKKKKKKKRSHKNESDDEEKHKKKKKKHGKADETQNKADETRNKIDLINPSVKNSPIFNKTISQSSSQSTSINRTRNRPRASDLW